jgi:hypothetical protein
LLTRKMSPPSRKPSLKAKPKLRHSREVTMGSEWGENTARDDVPLCALPPEDWIAKWGKGNKARGKKVAVTYKGKTVMGELRDTMPHKAKITNGAGIDLNPGFAKAFHVRPPFILKDVHWDWG